METRVVGDVVVDAEGRFLPDADALRFLDYWAQARGEEPAPVLRGRVEEELARRLPESARAEVLETYDQYLRYLDESRAFVADSTDTEALALQYDEQRKLRSEIFGPSTAYALFREQTQVEEVTLERRRILSDPTITDRERIARLAEVRGRLPDAVQKEESEAYSDLRLSRHDPGPGEASWSARMQAYREERDRVLYNVRNAPEEAKSVFLNRVRERHFNADEVLRVEALDRIELRERTLGRAPLPVE